MRSSRCSAEERAFGHVEMPAAALAERVDNEIAVGGRSGEHRQQHQLEVTPERFTRHT